MSAELKGRSDLTPALRTRFESWALVGPAVAVYSLFVIVPIAGAVAMSLVDLRPGGEGWSPTLDNFVRAFLDVMFWRALAHNFALLAASLVIQLPIAMALALFVAGLGRSRPLFRAGYFLPMMVTAAAIGRIWMLVFDPLGGPVNGALEAAGVSTDSLPDWFGSTTLALPTVIFVISWRYIGFHMVILLAGLISIPRELYEAARVDGSGRWECFRHVTLPMMSRPLKISAMLAVVGSMRYFDLVYIMTKGGPDGSTELVATYMFKNALGEAGEYSYGAALAVLLAVSSLAVVAGARMLLPREDAAEAVR